MIDAHQVQQGRVEVVDVDFVFDRVKSEVIGGSVMIARLYPGSRHPDREAVGVVVATVLLTTRNSIEKFEGGSASEFAAADDEGVVEQTAPVQVVQETGDGLVHGLGVAAMACLQRGMLVPVIAVASGCVIDGDVADPRLGEAPGEE